MRMKYARYALLAFAFMFTGTYAAEHVSATTQTDLAPRGKLRVGLNLGNLITVSRDTATGELRGMGVELGRALARDLGVEFEPVEYSTSPNMAAAAKKGEWDIAFLAIDPARAVDMAFTKAYMGVDNTILVPPNSAIRTLDDLDRPGIRIATLAKSAPDLFLSRTLRHAELISTTKGDEVAFDMVRTGQADAIATSRGFLLTYAPSLPGARVLEENLVMVEHAIAVPIAGKDSAGFAYLRDFVERAKRNGFVQRSIEKFGLKSVHVAP